MVDKIAYNGWLKVYKRTVKNRTYDILKDYNAVSAIIVNEYKELLLVKQFRPALMRTTFEIPAGTMEREEENAVECILRELKEETGLEINPESITQVVSYKPMIGFSNSLMKVFLFNILKQDVKPNAIKDEDISEILWMGREELRNKISEGEIQDVKTILAYYYLQCNSL